MFRATAMGMYLQWISMPSLTLSGDTDGDNQVTSTDLAILLSNM